MKSAKLVRCPNCGSPNIRLEKKPFRARVRGKTIAIPELEREICPDCKQEFFDREANIVIDSYCFSRSRKRA